MSTASAPGARPEVVLRVERVHDGQTMIVRTLSDEYGGLFVHGSFIKGKWHGDYCDPAWCCTGKVKDKRQWYGYSPCQWWKEEQKAWFPIALEITEALELDFRDRWARGQVWELFRPTKQDKKQFPTVGRLLRQDAPETLPEAFDVRPALFSIYHVHNIPLNVPNPHPGRVMLSTATGDAPELPKMTLEMIEKQRAQEEYRRKRLEEQRRRA
jgi:hypothetical protein